MVLKRGVWGERKREKRTRKEEEALNRHSCHFLYHTGSCKELTAADCNISDIWECEGMQKKEGGVHLSKSSKNNEKCPSTLLLYIFNNVKSAPLHLLFCDASSSSEARGVSESSLMKRRVKCLWFLCDWRHDPPPDVLLLMVYVAWDASLLSNHAEAVPEISCHDIRPSTLGSLSTGIKITRQQRGSRKMWDALPVLTFVYVIQGLVLQRSREGLTAATIIDCHH